MSEKVTSTRTGIGPQLAPCAATGLLVVAAAAAHAVAAAGDSPAGTALTVGGAAFVLAVLVAMKRGARISCRKARARLRVLLLGAAAWLGVVTATGVNWIALQVLAALMVSVSLHWWSARRIPNHVPEAPASVLTSAYADLWKENVARKGKTLAGTTLEGVRAISSGTQATLRLVPGEHSMDTVEQERKKIRGALGLKREHDLILEPHPTLPEPHLQLTIVTTPPPRGSILWPGPSALGEDGMIDLGPFADGVGTARWTAFTKTRVMCGFLQGGTNSGKTRMFESIGLSIAASKTFPSVVIFADGQGGASSRLLKENADHTALTLDALREALRGLIRLGEHRQEENDIFGWDGFTATVDRPAVFLLMDECHKFFVVDGEVQEDIQAMCAQIAREFGKVGIALIAATQMATLSAAFGPSGKHADAIRSNLLMGNGVMLRGKSRGARTIFGVETDPTLFPDRPGYALLAGSGEGVRIAPFLGYFASDEVQAHWLPRILWRSLDVASASAWGASYINRKAIAEAAREAKRARVEARRAGRTVDPAPQAAPRRHVPAPPFEVRPFPVWVNPGRRPQPQPEPQDVGVSDVARKVAVELVMGDVLHNGYARPVWLAKRLGYSERHIGNALNELLARGMVRKDGTQGHWYPTDKILSREVA